MIDRVYDEGTVLIYTDFHKRYKDFTSIKGYCKALRQVDKDLINLVDKHDINIAISAGDLYDGGYAKISSTIRDTFSTNRLTEKVNGNHFITLGNHFFLERDSNPEMYLIQPNSKYTPREDYYAEEPVIYAVDSILVGCVQFSFFHYSKTNKDYVAERDPRALYHVGIYHDTKVVPSAAREKCGIYSEVSSEYLNKIFANVDLAVIGHIHEPIGVVNMLIKGRTVPAIIPGSLCICKSNEVHSSIKLPIFKCEKDVMSLLFESVSTHSEMLTIVDSKDNKKEDIKKLSSNITNSLDITEDEGLIFRASSVDDFIREDRTVDERAVTIFRKASYGELTIADAIKAVYETNESKGLANRVTE